MQYVVWFSFPQNWCREFRKWLGNERIKAFDIGSDKKVEVRIRSYYEAQ